MIAEFEYGLFFEIVIEQFIIAEVVPADLKNQLGLAVAAVIARIDQPDSFVKIVNVIFRIRNKGADDPDPWHASLATDGVFWQKLSNGPVCHQNSIRLGIRYLTTASEWIKCDMNLGMIPFFAVFLLLLSSFFRSRYVIGISTVVANACLYTIK